MGGGGGGGVLVGHLDPVFSMHSIKAVCGFDALSFQVSCNNGSRKPVFSLGLMIGLLILAHGHLLFGEHGQTIVAATALLACPDQQDLSF